MHAPTIAARRVRSGALAVAALLGTSCGDDDSQNGPSGTTGGSEPTAGDGGDDGNTTASGGEGTGSGGTASTSGNGPSTGGATGSTTGGASDCLDLATQAIGFGRNARGGVDGPVVHVTTLDDGGPGSLREAAAMDGAAWIVFDVSGTIALGSPVDVTSDKTLDGRNQDVVLSGSGLSLDGVTNVIVENLTFDMGAGDALTIIDGTTDVWIDHLSITGYDDGAIDITETATDVTVSWTHVYQFGKVMLVSASDTADYDAVIRVTSHHNFFDGTEERHPRLRFGRVHAFNNLVEGWLYYGMRIHLTGQLVSENNVFIAGANENAIVLGDDTEVRVRSTGDLLQGGAIVEEKSPDLAFVPADTYAYELDPADDALIERLRELAGRRDLVCEW